MIRKFTLILLSFIYASALIYGQNQSKEISKEEPCIKENQVVPKRDCGQLNHTQYLISQDPTVVNRLQDLEEYTQRWIANNPDYEQRAVITIPVVFHIVYQNSTENVADIRVTEAIAQLNRDYSGLNTHSIGSFATNLRANTNIQFCLAKRKPNGTSTNGIDRVSTTVSAFSYDDKVKSTTTGGANAWDVTKYLNIWVCDLGSSLCGYGQFPYSMYGGGVNSTYGLVIHYKYFGSTGAYSPYNQGGTSSHEIGHCFNLFHIWGDDQGGNDPSVCSSGTCCSGSDNCNDTPNQSVCTYGTASGVKTDACTASSPGVMYMNFMDYTDDASYAFFTPNQATRMAALFVQGGPLYSLTTSNGCSPVSGIEDENSLDLVEVFPNPSSGEINIAFGGEVSGTANVKIYSNIGTLIFENIYSNITNKELTVNLNAIESGVYYVSIQNEGRFTSKRILIIK